VSDRVSGQVQKGVNSVVILGAWNLWNQRNRCVFDGADPDLSNIISNTKEDLQQSVESETLAPKAQECSTQKKKRRRNVGWVYTGF